MSKQVDPSKLSASEIDARLAFLQEQMRKTGGGAQVAYSSVQQKTLDDVTKTIDEEGIQSATDVMAEAANTAKTTMGGADLSISDEVFYTVENRIASNAAFPFIALACFFVFLLICLGSAWYDIAKNDEAALEEGTLGSASLADGLFVSMQVLMAAGFDDVPGNSLRVVYFLMIFIGLVVFAILVGFITDTVTSFMKSLATGRTKVAETDHTLILGWNEATIRVVIQTSFLRRQYQELNESKFMGLTILIPWLNYLFKLIGLLERPSTSMAANDIVIMTNTLTKDEMHIRLANALQERGINPRRTKIGQNIICRVGDPTNVIDLIRVGAHRAAAIVVMLTDKDNEEEDYSDGAIQNGATLRCALALRHVVFGNRYSARDALHPELRMILQMTSPSKYVNAACFKNDAGNDVIMPMDLSVFLNSLMFSCATQPGLATVLLDLLNFEGTSIRRRKAINLKSGPNDQYGYCIGRTFGEMRKQFTVAIFIGIMRPSVNTRKKIIQAGLGICCDPDTVIQKDDLLLFIGPRSNPRHESAMVDTMNGYVETARSMIKAHNPQGVSEEKNLKHIVLCGWREVWEDAPQRFSQRCRDLTRLRLPGSTVTMLNGVEKPRFEALMKKIGWSRAPNEIREVPEDLLFASEDDKYNWTYTNKEYPDVYIIHVVGDASLPSVLHPICMKRKVNTAIVLGTQAVVRLNGHSRDTRVLSIMLLLRQICNEKSTETGDNTPMHIVGENSEDLTAKLALAPRVTTKSGDDHASAPDFINTQAIYARAITQTMAYPLIAPAVADLFDDEDGSANIEIVRASAYVPKECFQNITIDKTQFDAAQVSVLEAISAQFKDGIKYGIIRAAVLQAVGERSICIGYMHARDGIVHLTPDHAKLIPLEANDRLIVLRRVLLN